MLGKDNIQHCRAATSSSSKTKQVSGISENLFPSPKILLPLSSHDSWIWQQQLHCYQHGPPFALLVEGLGLQKHCQLQEALPPSDRFVVPEIREISPPAVFMEAIRLREASKGFWGWDDQVVSFCRFFWEGRDLPWSSLFWGKNVQKSTLSSCFLNIPPKGSPKGVEVKHCKTWGRCNVEIILHLLIIIYTYRKWDWMLFLQLTQAEFSHFPATCTLESWAFSSK